MFRPYSWYLEKDFSGASSISVADPELIYFNADPELKFFKETLEFRDDVIQHTPEDVF